MHLGPRSWLPKYLLRVLQSLYAQPVTPVVRTRQPLGRIGIDTCDAVVVVDRTGAMEARRRFLPPPRPRVGVWSRNYSDSLRIVAF